MPDKRTAPSNTLVRVAGSTRLGIALLSAIALYLALGTLPLGPLFQPLGGTPDTAGRTLRHLPAIDLTESEYHATPILLALAAALLGNLAVSTITRVPRTRARIPAHLAHLGIAVLTIGGVIHSHHAINLKAVAFDTDATHTDHHPEQLRLFDLDTTALAIDSPALNGPRTLRLNHLPRYTPSVATPARPLARTNAAGHRIAVTALVPRGRRVTELVEEPGAGPAVQLTEILAGSPAAQHTLDARDDRPAPTTTLADGTRVVLARPSPADAALLAAQSHPATSDGAVIVATPAAPPRRLERPGDTASIDGLTVEWIERIGDRAVVRLQPADAIRATTRTLRPFDPIVAHDSIDRPETAAAPANHADIVYAPAGGGWDRTLVFIGGQKLAVRDGNARKTIQNPAVRAAVRLGPSASVRIDEVKAAARARDTVVPEPASALPADLLTDEREGAWARVRITPAHNADRPGPARSDPPTAHEIWVPFALLGEAPVAVRTDPPLELRLGPGVRTAETPPFRLGALHTETYPATDLPRSLTAEIAHPAGDFTVGLNRPASLALPGVGPVKATLSGYDPAAARDRWGSQVTAKTELTVPVEATGRFAVLRFTSTRGLGVVWAGVALLGGACLATVARTAAARARRRRSTRVPGRTRMGGALAAAACAAGIGVVWSAAAGLASQRASGPPHPFAGLAAHDGRRVAPLELVAARWHEAVSGEAGGGSVALDRFVRAAAGGLSAFGGAERFVLVEEPAACRALGVRRGALVAVPAAAGVVGGGDGGAGMTRLAGRLALIDGASALLRVWPAGGGWREIGWSGAPAGGEWSRLVSAFEAGDGPAARDSVGVLGSLIGAAQRRGLRDWDRRRLGVERWASSSSLLGLGVAGCGVAGAMGAVLAWGGAGRGGRGRGAMWAVDLGMGCGGASALLGAVALRCVASGRVAVQNQWESVVGLAAAGGVLGVGALVGGLRGGRRSRLWLGVCGFAVAGVFGVAALVGGGSGVLPGERIEPEAGVLSSSWVLGWHVSAMLVGYALVSGGALLGVGVLVERWRGGGASVGALDAAARGVGLAAVWVLAVGLVLGAWWADRAWGRWWAFDAKESWALVLWLVVLCAVHVPWALSGSGAGARAAVWRGVLLVVAFVVMLWTYFGVNLLLPSLHSYA